MARKSDLHIKICLKIMRNTLLKYNNGIFFRQNQSKNPKGYTKEKINNPSGTYLYVSFATII